MSEPTFLRVVRGDPSAEELAAVVAVVLAARAGSVDVSPSGEPSLWRAPQLRQTLLPGPGAWRASSLLR